MSARRRLYGLLRFCVLPYGIMCGGSLVLRGVGSHIDACRAHNDLHVMRTLRLDFFIGEPTEAGTPLLCLTFEAHTFPYWFYQGRL